jgi:hypothetical protein
MHFDTTSISAAANPPAGRKAQHEIGLERDDTIDLAVNADTFGSRVSLRRPHREPGNPDDASCSPSRYKSPLSPP